MSSPTNSFITNTTTQNLSWQSIIGATSYQVQISDINNVIINDQNLTVTNVSYAFPDGSYNWRVRAMNGTNQTLYTSRSILVDATKPNTAILSNPANGSVTTTTSVSFQWNRIAIPGSVERDEISIYTNSALTNLQFTGIQTSPFTTTLPVGTYYWVVKSYDIAGNISNPGTVFNFTIN